MTHSTNLATRSSPANQLRSQAAHGRRAPSVRVASVATRPARALREPSRPMSDSAPRRGEARRYTRSAALGAKGRVSTPARCHGAIRAPRPDERPPASAARCARRGGLCECAMRRRNTQSKRSDDPGRSACRIERCGARRPAARATGQPAERTGAGFRAWFQAFGSLVGNPGETHEWATVKASVPGHGRGGGGPPPRTPGATQGRGCASVQPRLLFPYQIETRGAREGAARRRCVGSALLRQRSAPRGSVLRAATWLILPVVICLSQRLSHACLSISCLYCETANGSLNQL